MTIKISSIIMEIPTTLNNIQSGITAAAYLTLDLQYRTTLLGCLQSVTTRVTTGLLPSPLKWVNYSLLWSVMPSPKHVPGSCLPPLLSILPQQDIVNVFSTNNEQKMRSNMLLNVISVLFLSPLHVHIFHNA